MGPQAFNPQADNIDLIPNHHLFGGVSERPKEPVLKTGVVQATVGSNPTPSASLRTRFGWQASKGERQDCTRDTIEVKDAKAVRRSFVANDR